MLLKLTSWTLTLTLSPPLLNTEAKYETIYDFMHGLYRGRKVESII
jgi:hypothetical protein